MAHADEIADFYDRHPYPPPVTELEEYRRSWQDPQAARAEHFRMWPSLAYRDDHTILVAGCGTSQAAKRAMRSPHARVIGVDVSASSIQQTRLLAERYQLNNLEIHQVAIEDVASLAVCFDEIVCTGVLHHLEDPASGLASLREVLAQGGALHLMVYATYGRTGVSMIQEYCRRLGISTSEQDVAALVASLKELPLGHPLSHMLRDTPDFLDRDALADALLNPRECSYSVPEFFALVEGAGLEFGRWLRQAPYLPQCGSVKLTPHSDVMSALPIRDQYAAVELFRGTIKRHSAILHHNGEPLRSDSMSFAGASWRDYVPIRPPSVAVVTERVPSGSSAALLNRSHSHRDLVMFVNSEQLRVFESVDGVRTLGEITEDPSFFERLWNHDLVLFDLSSGA